MFAAPTTIREFAEACNFLSHEEIYTLFEFAIDDELRDEIYTTFQSDGPEPVRAAFNEIGRQYNILSLLAY